MYWWDRQKRSWQKCMSFPNSIVNCFDWNMSVKVNHSSISDSATPLVHWVWTPWRPYVCRPGIPSIFEPIYPTWQLCFQKLKHSTHKYDDNNLSQDQLEKIHNPEASRPILWGEGVGRISGEAECLKTRVSGWTWASVSRWTPHEQCLWRQRRLLLQLLRNPPDPVDKLFHSSLLRCHWFSHSGWKIMIS